MIQSLKGTIAAGVCAMSLAVSLAPGAHAGEIYGVPHAYAEEGGYGFADPAVRGAYIGAPLTRFPRPSALVPPAWGYGTYGIPTLSGIARPPVGEPTLTVIRAREPARVERRGSRILSRDRDGGWTQARGTPGASGVRVLTVEVPRR